MDHCPEEVSLFAIALGIVWAAFLSGIMGDVGEGLFEGNAETFGHESNKFVFFHGIALIVLAGALYAFWRYAIFPRMIIGLMDQKNIIQHEEKFYAKVNALNDGLE